MSRRETSEKILDATLKLLVGATALGTALILPNILIALDKPLKEFLDTMDERERTREARRVIYYMKQQGLLAGEYEHGLKITRKGRKRLAKLEFANIKIDYPKAWDHIWRVVFYDIPEQHKSARDILTARLRELGFFQLQRSAWIHPFPCREVVIKLTTNYEIEKYVSYIETQYLDNQSVLIKRFQKRMPHVAF